MDFPVMNPSEAGTNERGGIHNAARPANRHIEIGIVARLGLS
jgi:hypothetical protein